MVAVEACTMGAVVRKERTIATFVAVPLFSISTLESRSLVAAACMEVVAIIPA